MPTQTETEVKRPKNPDSRRCTAVCTNGSPCRAWAVRGSSPLRCSAHGGGRAPVGAPRGNQNARTYGFYARHPGRSPSYDAAQGQCTIDQVIADLHAKQQLLSGYIDAHLDELRPADLARFLRIHAQACSRLGRLLRDREALSGGFDELLSGAIGQALTELGEELGVDLT